MSLLALVLFSFAHASASDDLDLSQAWKSECDRLLHATDPYDMMTAFPALDAAFTVTASANTVRDDDIGRLIHFIHLHRPIPTHVLVQTRRDGQIIRTKSSPRNQAEMTTEDTERDAAALSALGELAAEVDRLETRDAILGLESAFPKGRFVRAGVTYASRFAPDAVNVVSDALVEDDATYRVRTSRFVHFTPREIVFDIDAVDVDHFEFRHPRPSFDLVRSAARRFLILDSCKFRRARIDVVRTATGFRVGVRRTSTDEYLELVVDSCGGQHIVELDRERSLPHPKAVTNLL